MPNDAMVAPKLQLPSLNEIWCWCICLGALGYAAWVLGLSDQGITADVVDAGGVNLAAWAMVAARLRRLGPASPAPPGLVAAALAFGAGCAVPLAPWLALCLAGLGLGLLWRRDTSAAGRQAGWLILLLGICWGAPFAKPLHMMVARVDAVIAGLLVRLAGSEAIVTGNIVGTPRFSIEVFTACASSTPVPEVLLAYLVVVFYRGGRLSRAHLPYIAGSIGVSVILSEIRLALMVPSHAAWEFWHFGMGATMYQLVALAAALLWPFCATRAR